MASDGVHHGNQASLHSIVTRFQVGCDPIFSIHSGISFLATFIRVVIRSIFKQERRNSTAADGNNTIYTRVSMSSSDGILDSSFFVCRCHYFRDKSASLILCWAIRDHQFRRHITMYYQYTPGGFE